MKAVHIMPDAFQRCTSAGGGATYPSLSRASYCARVPSTGSTCEDLESSRRV